jgi:hypothetical protein
MSSVSSVKSNKLSGTFPIHIMVIEVNLKKILPNQSAYFYPSKILTVFSFGLYLLGSILY